MTDSASYLSAVSVMLAAFGFFYGNYREAIRAGLEVGEPSESDNAREHQSRQVKAGLAAARPLALVALIVWAIFLGPVIEAVGDAVDVGFSLDHYSAIDVAFVLAATAWLPIAALLLTQTGKLWRKRREFE